MVGIVLIPYICITKQANNMKKATYQIGQKVNFQVVRANGVTEIRTGKITAIVNLNGRTVYGIKDSADKTKQKGMMTEANEIL